MSNIKDLFSGKKSDKLLENSTAQEVGSSVESADYLKSNIKDKKRFIPHVDFTTASNFAIYGSAEKYYEDSYNYILKQYPYDGSSREKIEWKLSGTYLDQYIFENEYPRTTGYINFGQSYGSVTTDDTGYDTSDKNEWIYFKGHNVGYSLNTQINPELTLQFDKLNIYNTASQGLSNLELEGSGGISTEFWLHKQSFSAGSESRRQVIVDIWNSGSWGVTNGVSSSYGRFRVEISGTQDSVMTPAFHVELLSGSSGFSSDYVPKSVTSDYVPTIIMSGSKLTGSSWNHFALTFENNGTQMTGRLYTNGSLTYTYTGGTSIGTITGSMLGQIGSLVGKVSSSTVARGYGKLSGSLDEFRFWKTRRTAKQVGQYWFTQVHGGTNTDLTLASTASTKYSYENPADLGVYYKFNEGIINTSSINSKDAIVIDYAGRVTNGQWTGYTTTSRNTGSAIMSASAAISEYEDPILYSSHPLVSTFLTDKKSVGKFHDETSNSTMYGSLPEWITSDDQNKGNSALQNLTQIIASYFDTLYLQIQAVPGLKNKNYISGSDKPVPFVNRFIDASGFLTSEIFTKATDLEYLDARSNTKKFENKVNELKNLIYKNIYNNLVYIYKSKGTEKSFRNLIRSFGVDKELVNIRLYGDEVTHKLQDNYDNFTVRKRYVDFYSDDRLDAVVYQQTASGNTYSRGYISASSNVHYRGNTYELESYFPKDKEKGTDTYFNAAFLTASIFGCHTSGTAGATTWGTPDYGQFQIQSVRTDTRRSAAFFQLTCSNDGLGVLSKLTSSVFQDVYDGTRWNFAVRIKPKKYPLADGVSGSTTGQYDVEFSGYNYVLDVLNNSFVVTSSITATNAQRFLRTKKRFFVGAHRTNTTGAVLQRSNIKASSLRVWMDYLTSSVLQAHAKDVTNFGTLNPYRDAYITQLGVSLGSKNVKSIPQLETLILNWDFDTVTSSDAGGNFIVPDVSIASSGTNNYTGRWGWLGPIGQYQHTGYGFGFPANATGSIDRRYVHTLELQPPEIIASSNLVSLVDEDQNKLFSRDSRPEQYFFAFEKSMYNTISKEIIDIFATIVDFNNLIGEPVNRYRQEYKQMQKLRQLYFERVQNTLNLNKFVEYFKWLDSSISVMLQQLVPGSAKFSENLRTMVESHVLERNKYWTKFPTLEMKVSDPEAGVFGINEMLYSGKRGLAPIPTTATGSNCEWWLERANRDNSNITSGDSTVDSQRDKFRNVNDFRSGSGPTLAVSRKTTATTTTYKGSAYALRNFTKPFRLTVDESLEIHGGSNFPRNKTVEYIHTALKFGSSEKLEISASSIPAEKSCNDVIIPNSKKRLEAKVANTSDRLGYTSGKSEIFAPLSLFSSSVTTGYIADVATNFRTKTEIDNYHDDIYGDDKGIPVQGPFTERHVGGRQHRHININSASTDTILTRPEAWNLQFTGTVSAAEPEKSMYFQDGGQYVTVPSASSLPIGAGADFSISFWVRPEAAGYNPGGLWKTMITRQDGTFGKKGWGVHWYGTGYPPAYQIQFYVGDYAAGSAITSGLTLNTWHHVVATYDDTANELYAYINTVQSTVGTRGSTATSVAAMTIGTGPDAQNDFDGYINNVALFNKVLSTAEVSAIYNSGCPEDMRGLSGITNWWRLGDGDTYDQAKATIGSVDGTMTNMVAGDIVEEAACATTVEPAITTTSLKTLKFTSRTADQPRATMIRDAYAKRPLNIANIKWGTSSAVVGNYRMNYEAVQTGGRTLNNKFFIINGGFDPISKVSPIFDNYVEYALPRLDLTGTNKTIFVERFNAPGGPEVSSRGALNLYGEEYASFNNLNYRNLIVRDALKGWQTAHCGQFGIVSVSGAIQGYRQPRWQDYGTLANYHKINRNPRQIAFIKDASREVEFTKLIYVDVSNYNRTFVGGSTAGTTGVQGIVESHQQIQKYGYFEVELNSVANPIEHNWYMGLTSYNITLTDYGSSYPTYYWLFDRSGGTNYLQAYEWDGSSTSAIGARIEIADGLAIGDKIRILKDGSRVVYQYKPVSSDNWTDHVESTIAANGTFHPTAMFRKPGYGFTNPRISNPQYDNWYVQHPIPQSDLQYAWINDSYNRSKDQPFGYVGGCHDADGLVPFTVPSGSFSSIQIFILSSVGTGYTVGETITGADSGATARITSLIESDSKMIVADVNGTFEYGEALASSGAGTGAVLSSIFREPASTVQPSIQFVSASDFGSYQSAPSSRINFRWGRSSQLGAIIPTDFVGINFNIYEPVTSSTNNLGYPPDVPFMAQSYWYDQYTNAWAGAQGTSYGVDGYMVQAQSFNALMLHRNGPYQYPSWKQTRTGEHPVARHHKRNNILSIQSPPAWITLPKPSGSKPGVYYDKRPNSFTNFIEPPVTFKNRPLVSNLNDFSLRHTYANNKGLWTQRGLPLAAPEPSVAEFLQQPNEKGGLQIYDKLQTSKEYMAAFAAGATLTYSEVIFPRGANTGLTKIRGRLAYAETADVLDRFRVFPPTASLSLGSNGIDRGPLYRRTLWRDADYNRNRYGPPNNPAGYSPPAWPWFSTTISNSCGNQDGFARSVWCFGEEPLVFAPPTSSLIAHNLRANLSGSTIVNEYENTVTIFPNNDGRDTGELNSWNIAKMSGFFGSVSMSMDPNSFNHQFYVAPSASAYYYHLPYYGIERGRRDNDCFDAGGGTFVDMYNGRYTYELCKGMKWTAAKDSGKKPFFDSYEEFAKDIRGLSKAWTILPEFKISDHMSYYVDTRGGKFRAKNDKFLSLNGASITQSADRADSVKSISSKTNKLRNFDANFFKEYSFSDFQKYFGTFAKNFNLGQITLKCNAVKKLLPYKGFYPADRSTQLVSLFSGALGQFVGGGAVTSSCEVTRPLSRIQSGSDQLALQALLQPWFAPGILYNTIKSGIAVDWPVYTGSLGRQGCGGCGGTDENASSRGFTQITSSVATRFPFASLLDPLDYIPNSSSDGSHRLLLNATSYMNFAEGADGTQTPRNSEYPRVPFAEFSPKHPDKSVLSLYSSAMHNYLAEIPNFFLKDSRLKTIESLPQDAITIKEGDVYVMDVYIEKTNNAPNDELIMIQDYYNGYVSASFGAKVVNVGVLGTVWGHETTGIPTPNGQGVTGSYNGKYFGPKWRVGTQDNANSWYNGYAIRDSDPAHAPVTPPYFYGKARVRLIYTGSAEDAQRSGAGKGPNFRKIFNNMTMSFKNDGDIKDDPRGEAWFKFDKGFANQYTPSTLADDDNAAWNNMMDVTASLDIRGVKPDPNDPTNDGKYRWVIAPFMETPVLDFSESQTPERGYGRGMWSGYGEIPANNRGIYFGIERSPNTDFANFSGGGLMGAAGQKIQDMTKWFKNTHPEQGKTVSNFIYNVSEKGKEPWNRKKIGEIAEKKTISEAIVAIPFCTNKISPRKRGQDKTTDLAKTTVSEIIGKNFFSLDSSRAVSTKQKQKSRYMFEHQKRTKLEQGMAIPLFLGSSQQTTPLASARNPMAVEFNLTEPGQEKIDTSISKMALLMDKYIIPPELDFNKYDDIEPFAMYIMEFNHELDEQDLSDIWQGLMPEISRTAEEDEAEFTHETAPYEFFGGKDLPPCGTVRWMVFKVKRRAAINYWSMTPSSVDDWGPTNPPPAEQMRWSAFEGTWPGRLDHRFNPLGMDYSYNWPYDYFSLVELAEIEVENQFKKRPSAPGAADLRFGMIGGGT